MKLLNIEDKTMAVDRVQFSLLKEERTKKKKLHQLLSSIKPSSVPSSATVAFLIEWVLVRDANVFMDDVLWEYCRVKPPFIHSGDTHIGLARGLQLQYENTENDGFAVWLKQSKPLLLSVTHGASGL